MNENKLLLCNVDNLERARFFYRMNKACKNKNIVIFYITQSYASYMWLKYRGEKVEFLRIQKVKDKNILEIDIENVLKKTIDFQLKKCTLNDCINMFYSTITCLENIEKYRHIDYIFSWSGYKITDYACRTFVKNNNTSILFFEIPNIPGKIFVDKFGTNAQSEIYNNKNIIYIKEDNTNLRCYNDWKNNYINYKLKEITVPQAKTKSLFILLIRTVFDIYGMFIGGFPIYFEFLKYKLKEFLQSKHKIQYDNINLQNKKYVFFPLQVSTDVQVIINSDIKLKEAINYAKNYAKKNDIELIIKPHPAEKNMDIINYIKEIKNDYKKIYISNFNTFNLIYNSLKVITINSTVGLEAMILNKKVEILGDSFYKHFTNKELESYIMNYLIDIDYFSNKKISDDDLKKIIDRTK